MKKLSLLSLLWLAGLLAFFATPIYAQEEDVLDAEDLVYESEDVNAEDEFNYEADTEDVDLEIVDEENVEEAPSMDEVNQDIDDSIEDVMWILNDEEESTDEGTSDKSSIQLRIGNDVIVIDSLAFFLTWIWLVMLIVTLVRLILCHIALWRIFWRAWEWKWKSLIPIYNLYIVFKIAGIKNWFWYILLVIFIAAIISAIFPIYQDNLSNFSGEVASTVILLAWFLLAKKFGRSDSASILYTIFSGIAILILWFWDYKYEGKSEDKSEETIVEA